MAVPFVKNVAKTISEKVFKIFGNNSGKMLLNTSIIGIALSSMAQMGMIVANDKYSTSQKTFMFFQEGMECLLSVLSIFLVTKPTQKFTSKALQSGKILSKDLVAYLEKNKLYSKRGKVDFNMRVSIKNIMDEIEKSDKFVKSSLKERESLISEHKKAIQDYDTLTDSSMAIATTGAVAFSTALIIPFGRNKVASYCQKHHIERKAKLKDSNIYSQQKNSLYINKPL